MPSESTLNSLVLDFTQRFPIISPRNNQKTHRIQRNRGVNMVKQNNHMRYVDVLILHLFFNNMKILHASF